MQNISRAIFCSLLLAGCTVNGKSLLSSPFGSSNPPPQAKPVAANQASAPGRVEPPPPVFEKAHAPTPAAPGAVSANGKPAWCAKMKEDGKSLSDALENNNPRHALAAIAYHLCFEPEHPKRAAIEARRQWWLSQLQMTENDWASDFVEWTNMGNTVRLNSTIEVNEGKGAWSSLTPLDQMSMMFRWGGTLSARAYVADAIQLSELGRIGYIHNCLEQQNLPVALVACAGDIDIVNYAKAGEEIRNDKSRPAVEKMVARFVMQEAKSLIARVPARIDAAIDDLPWLEKGIAYAKKDARAAWKPNELDKEILALLVELEETMSAETRLAKDCDGRSKQLFDRAIATIPTSAYEGMTARGDTREAFTKLYSRYSPTTYLATLVRRACTDDSLLSLNLNGLAGYRGPRTLAVMKTGQEFPTGAVSVRRAKQTQPPRLGDRNAVVDNVIDSGDTVKVIFVKEPRGYTACLKWRETNKIERITDTGYVQYKSECLQEKEVRYTERPEAIEIPKALATGIAKGKLLIIDEGMPAVFANDKSTRPIAVYGYAVK